MACNASLGHSCVETGLPPWMHFLRSWYADALAETFRHLPQDAEIALHGKFVQDLRTPERG